MNECVWRHPETCKECAKKGESCVPKEIKMAEWRITDYIDVWYNDEEGWWVNQSHIEDETLVIREDATDEDIVAALIDRRLLSPICLTERGLAVEVENLGTNLEIISKEDQQPLYGLTLIE